MDFKMTLASTLMVRRFTADLQQTIFDHALRTNRRIDRADVQRLLLEDVDNIADAIETIHTLWYAPLQAIIWFGILWATVGPAALFGIVAVCMVILVNGMCCSAAKSYERRASAARRKSALKLNEFIDNIRTVKLCGWEQYFVDQLANSRVLIVKNTKFRLLVNGFGFVLFTTAPLLISMIILAANVMLLKQSNTIEKVYRVLAAALQLRWACDTVPSTLVACQKAAYSKRVISVFMRDCQSCDSLPECSLNSTALLNPGKVTGIIGLVGCGKTTLIRSILDRQSSIGPLSYVPQQCWLENESIKDNILFGKSFEKDCFQRVVRACGLDEDFKRMSDSVRVVQNGRNLSGGQRQRICLARALYQDLPTILLDDPLSAVDKELAKKILTSLFSTGGILRERTVLFASSSLKTLPPCQSLYWLRDEKLTKVDHNACSTLVNAFADATGAEVDSRSEKGTDKLSDSFVSASKINTTNGDQFAITVEFYNFLRGYGMWTLIIASISSFLYQLLLVITRASIITWSASDSYSPLIPSFVAVVSALLVGVVATMAIVWPIIDENTRSQSSLFSAACHRVSALSFDERLLSEFRNICLVNWPQMDSSLPAWFSSIIAAMTAFLASCAMMVSKLGAMPSLCLLVPIIILVRQCFMKYHKIINDQNDNLFQCRSRLNDYITSTLIGTDVIRALNGNERFKSKVGQLLLECCRSEKTRTSTSASRSFWVRSLMNAALLCICGAALLLRLSSSATIILIASMNRTVDAMFKAFVTMSEFSTKASSKWRCDQISTKLIGDHIYTIQPAFGKRALGAVGIEFRDFSACYPHCDNNVLEDINLIIDPGEKLSIIGRTGSGKSSLALALMGILDKSSGSLTTTVGCSAGLSSYLTFIAQEPIQLIGPLRNTIDPFRRSRRSQIIRSLRAVNLWAHVKRLPDQIDCILETNDQRFSVGQRQLLSIARALLERRPLLVLDEATASVDDETCDQIEILISERFRKQTVLKITHRIEDAYSADRIVIMRAGRILEQGSPKKLLDDRESVFARLSKME